jgi:hypothetical protein
MAKEKTPGFGGQWIEIFSTGRHVDDAGGRHEIDAAFLDAVAGNLNLDLHEPPAVIGHPASDAPAYGWSCALRRNGDKLEAQLCDNEPQFEEMVRKGLFKKRSASFYLDAAKAPGGLVPALRHIGFLGAAPPAVKGLRDIHFKEGEAATFEFSEGATMTDAEKKAAEDAAKKTLSEAVKDFFKNLFGGDADRPASATFSEADQKKLVDEAVAAASAKFSEEMKTRDTKIEELTKQVGNAAGSSTRREIVAFCESVGAERLIPALKNMGVVNFMETLASIENTDDTKVSVISFSETEKKDVTTKISPLEWFQNFLKAMPPFVSFGEQFGGMKLKGDGSQIANPAELDAMRREVGVKTSTESAAAK